MAVALLAMNYQLVFHLLPSCLVHFKLGSWYEAAIPKKSFKQTASIIFFRMPNYIIEKMIRCVQLKKEWSETNEYCNDFKYFVSSMIVHAAPLHK